MWNGVAESGCPWTLGVWGQRVKPDSPVVGFESSGAQVGWVFFREGQEFWQESSQKPWEMVEQGRPRGVSIYEAIIIFHILEDKYYISPRAASSHSTLPKCSVLPVSRSLERLNALLFTHFSHSQWVIDSTTWPLASRGDGFKSILARHQRETKRSRTNSSSGGLPGPIRIALWVKVCSLDV